MTLTPEDIRAIAREVVRQLRQIDGDQQTERYLSTLSPAEQKRRAREEMRREDRERRG